MNLMVGWSPNDPQLTTDELVGSRADPPHSKIYGGRTGPHKIIVSPRLRRPSYLASIENANSTFPGAVPKLVYPELT